MEGRVGKVQFSDEDDADTSDEVHTLNPAALACTPATRMPCVAGLRIHSLTGSDADNDAAETFGVVCRRPG